MIKKLVGTYNKEEATKIINELIDVVNSMLPAVHKEFYIPTNPNCNCHLNITPCCPVHNKFSNSVMH